MCAAPFPNRIIVYLPSDLDPTPKPPPPRQEREQRSYEWFPIPLSPESVGGKQEFATVTDPIANHFDDAAAAATPSTSAAAATTTGATAAAAVL